MACFNTPTSQDFILRGDIQLGDEQFRGLFGWVGSKFSLQRGLSTVPERPPTHDVAPLRKAPVASVGHPTWRAAVKPNWESFKTAEQKKGKMMFRTAQRKQVAPVEDVVAARLGKKNQHLKRKVQNTLDRDHRWSMDTHVFKVPRVGEKPGGSEEWVGVDGFLEALYKDMP